MAANDRMYVGRLKRILTCHVQELSAEDKAELTKLIKEIPVAKAETKTEPDSAKRDHGA